MVRHRTSSPITHIVSKEEGEVMILGSQKIHRIILTHETVAHVSWVTSPSCIWLKLRNNIVESQLQITREGGIGDDRNRWSVDLKKLKEKPRVREYVMAPREESVYGRARVLEYSDKYPDFAYVLFIDHGDGAWLNWNCLAEISFNMKCHPWQAIPVSLFKVFPAIEFMGEQESNWNEDDVAILKEILDEYDLFRVKPIFGSNKYNDYSTHVKVELFGLKDDKEDTLGESIGHLFRINREAAIIRRQMYDSVQQPMFSSPIDPHYHIPLFDPNTVDDFCMEFPADVMLPDVSKLHLEQNGAESEEKKFGEQMADEFWKDNEKEEYTEIQLITLENLRRDGYDLGNNFCIFVNWGSTVSPYEFYAYPLKTKEVLENPAKAVHTLINDRINFSNELDTWYGQQANRHPLGLSTVRYLLEQGKPAFGIYEVYSEHSETGSWRRVEIVSLRPVEKRPGAPGASNDWIFCRVRFVDYGGTDIVPVANVLKIHKSHCIKPAMCMPLCMNKIELKDPATGWTERLNAYFRSVLRGDIPTYCELEENPDTKSPKENLEDQVPARNRRGVIFARELCIMTRKQDPLEKTLLKKLEAHIKLV